MQLTQLVIDGPEFARRESRAGGLVAIAELSRVAEYLANADGMLDCSLRGGCSEDGSGHFELQLCIRGELQLRCQRCLQEMRFPLQLEKRLRLVASGTEWPEEDVEDDNAEAVLASREMVVGVLIEDEVLLAIPISPRHQKCDTPVMKDTKQDASPFSVLRKLKID
jgi:uncharacterized protein